MSRKLFPEPWWGAELPILLSLSHTPFFFPSPKREQKREEKWPTSPGFSWVIHILSCERGRLFFLLFRNRGDSLSYFSFFFTFSFFSVIVLRRGRFPSFPSFFFFFFFFKVGVRWPNKKILDSSDGASGACPYCPRVSFWRRRGWKWKVKKRRGQKEKRKKNPHRQIKRLNFSDLFKKLRKGNWERGEGKVGV